MSACWQGRNDFSMAKAEYKELLSLEQNHTTQIHQGSNETWRDFNLVLKGSIVLLLLLILNPWLSFLWPLRLVMALAYILFVPGYCLAAALFPKKEDLDRIERNGLSLGLSIAWAPVLALVLNALPWGLRLWPVVIGELSSIALFSALAAWRRSQLPADKIFAPPPAWQPRRWWQSQLPAGRRIYYFIFFALALTSLALAWTFLVPTTDQFMTEFYMLGPDGLAENFPREASVGKEIGVTLGLANYERGNHIYRVEIWAVDPWSEGRRERLGMFGPYELARGDHREWPVTWQMPWAGDNQMVELLLFDDDRQDPYRRLRLFINIEP